MSEYIINGKKLEDIADAIREKTGSEAGIKLAEMPEKIRSIETGSSTFLAEVECNKQAILDFAVLGEKLKEAWVCIDHPLAAAATLTAQLTVTVGNLFPPSVLSSYAQDNKFVFSSATEIPFKLPEGRFFIGVDVLGDVSPAVAVNYETGSQDLIFADSEDEYDTVGIITSGAKIKSLTFYGATYKNICVFAGNERREYIPYVTPAVVSKTDHYDYYVAKQIPIGDILLSDSSILASSNERMILKYTAYTDKSVYDDAYGLSYMVKQREFWDVFQNCGRRDSYGSAFSTFWNSDTFCPFYNIIPTSANYMFLRAPIKNFNNLTMRGVQIDFSQCTDCEGIFSRSEFEEFTILNFGNAVNLNYTFSACSRLKSIDRMVVSSYTTFKDTFNACSALEKLIIQGTIGQNGLNLSWSTRLTKESLLSILNALKDHPTISSPLCTLGATNLAKLTQAEKNIAINKGWTLA